MAAAKTEPVERQHKSDSLALLYQGVFTGIVRLQSGRQRLSDSVVFRRRICEALQDAQKQATVSGYSAREARHAEFAVVAFLDETILGLKDPAREVWAKQTLSVQLFGEANAGEVFYHRLEELKGQTESSNLADVLEVYLLCLLLGFEGMHCGATRSEATLVAQRLRSRIDSIRGSDYNLSPELEFAAAGIAPAMPRTDRSWLILPVSALCGAILLFLAFKFHLSMLLSDLGSTGRLR